MTMTLKETQALTTPELMELLNNMIMEGTEGLNKLHEELKDQEKRNTVIPKREANLNVLIVLYNRFDNIQDQEANCKAFVLDQFEKLQGVLHDGEKLAMAKMGVKEYATLEDFVLKFVEQYKKAKTDVGIK